MALYTFIMAFRGGTYISQIKEKDLMPAIQRWAETLLVDEIQYLGEKVKTQIIQLVKDVEPNAINTTRNLWVISFFSKAGYHYVHIIKTQE